MTAATVNPHFLLLPSGDPSASGDNLEDYPSIEYELGCFDDILDDIGVFINQETMFLNNVKPLTPPPIQTDATLDYSFIPVTPEYGSSTIALTPPLHSSMTQANTFIVPNPMSQQPSFIAPKIKSEEIPRFEKKTKQNSKRKKTSRKEKVRKEPPSTVNENGATFTVNPEKKRRPSIISSSSGASVDSKEVTDQQMDVRR
jgi:hypothetical protein